MMPEVDLSDYFTAHAGPTLRDRFEKAKKYVTSYDARRKDVENYLGNSDKRRQELEGVAWNKTKPWYLRSTLVIIAGRLLRCLAIIFLWITCFLAFAYYPYHVQVRRIATVAKASVNKAELLSSGIPQCPDSTLSLVEKPFSHFTNGGNLGFAPYDSRDEDIYKQAKKDFEDDPLSVFDVWEKLQLWSRLLAIHEWVLLGVIILYTLAFINFAIVGTSILIGYGDVKYDNVEYEEVQTDEDEGRTKFKRVIRHDNERDRETFTSKYEFWSQVAFSVIGVVSAVIVTSHGVSAFVLQEYQLDVVNAGGDVCADGVNHCFTGGRMPLCEFMTSNGTLCDDFIVEDCHIFGQDEVPALDVLAFGQYKWGNYKCTEYYCPPSKDTMVTMASKHYWQSMGEGPELSLGVKEYSFDSTQGLIVSMHVFETLFVICTLFELAFLVFNAIVISIDGEWKSVVDLQKAKDTFGKLFRKEKDKTEIPEATVVPEGTVFPVDAFPENEEKLLPKRRLRVYDRSLNV